MVSSFFGAIQAVGQALDFINKDSTQELIKKGKLTMESKGSITSLLSETTLTPTIYISKELEMHQDIDKIINLNIDILASMVSRAFTLLTTLKGLKTTTAFDALNQKTVLGGMLSDLKHEDSIADAFTSSKGFTFGKEVVSGLQNDRKEKRDSFDSIPSVYSKEIDLKITLENGASIKVPMVIKARIEFVSVKEITESLLDKTYDKTFLERLSDVKAGLISAKNLWIPTDLWEEYKNKLIKDDKDLLKRAEQKDSISANKLISTGVLGFATYLGSIIVTADELEDIEVRILRGKVNNDAKKDKLLTDTRSSLLNVVDTSFNKLRILTKDNDGDTILDIKSLKKKSDGNDINEIFKMLIMSKGY